MAWGMEDDAFKALIRLGDFADRRIAAAEAALSEARAFKKEIEEEVDALVGDDDETPPAVVATGKGE